MPDKDEIRTKLFSKKERKIVMISLWNAEIELRQPTVGEMLDQSQETDQRVMISSFLIRQAYVPGTNEKVFSTADQDGILNWPYGKWVTDITEALRELTDLEIEEQEKL